MLKISLLHAPDYMILTPQNEKSPYRGRGDTPLPSVFFLKSEIIPPPPLLKTCLRHCHVGTLLENQELETNFKLTYYE